MSVGTTHTYTLQSSTTQSADGKVMIIDLSDEDHLALGNNAGLVTKASNTYLVMGGRAFEDVLARNVVAITSDKSLQVATFVVFSLSSVSSNVCVSDRIEVCVGD